MKDDNLYIAYLQDSVRKIEKFLVDFDEHTFLDDEKTQSAVMLQLLLIGETSKRISETTKSKINVPWKKMAGFRDMAVHDYYEMSLFLVWETTQTAIPELKEKLQAFTDLK